MHEITIVSYFLLSLKWNYRLCRKIHHFTAVRIIPIPEHLCSPVLPLVPVHGLPDDGLLQLVEQVVMVLVLLALL